MPLKSSIMPIVTSTPPTLNLNGNQNLVSSTSALSSCQNMPINLHATATLSTIHQAPPLTNGLKNGLKPYG